MSMQLSLSARPKTLEKVFGQEKLVKAIRNHLDPKRDRTIKGWVFVGPRGCGKTTIARILALSYQCKHQKIIGSPCLQCQQERHKYLIEEINCASKTGKEAIEEKLETAYYGVTGESSYRVFILDEVHQLSNSAKSLLLKYLEDTPDSAVFILCTTQPWNVTGTVLSRCFIYRVKELGMEALEAYVQYLLKRVKSKLPADRLVEELVAHNVKIPRLVCHAVEKYVNGESPEEAADVDGSCEIDIQSLTRSVVKGEWKEVCSIIKKSEGMEEIQLKRAALISYLKTVLLESPNIDDRTKAVAMAIKAISGMQNLPDSLLLPAFTAELFMLCSIFEKYKL